MLEFIKPDLEKEGISLKILLIDDYNTPNRSLAEREIDANFFQHAPFLEEQVKEFGYPIVSFAKTHLEPMGVYSLKMAALNELPSHAVIAIPNDPTNEGRALLLLEHLGLITLKKPTDPLATPLSIETNPKGLEFIEVDAAMLPRTLQDVDAAVINTNFALASHLKPALALENHESSYMNILVIHKGDEEREELIALKNALTSEKMREFIRERYKGALLPALP